MINPAVCSVFIGPQGSGRAFARSTSGAERQVGEPVIAAPTRPDTLLPVSRLRVALVALSTAVLTAACAAGQQAQTANERPTLDGTQATIGKISLGGVALHAPTDNSYPAGSTVAMSIHIVNNGQRPDTLTNVSSPAFGGWDVVSTPSVQTSGTTGSGGGSPQKIGPQAAISLGLGDLTSNGTGSATTLVLTGLKSKSAPLYPGTAVKITFTFAKAGSKTLVVPVQITKGTSGQTLRPSFVPPSA